jgi:3-methyladenine DNA glycosylase AlkD
MDIQTVQQQIRSHLRANAHSANPVLSASGYTGSPHMVYAVSAPICRAVLKRLVRDYKEASSDEWLALMDALIAGDSHEEKTMAGRLLGYVPRVLRELEPERVDRWLGALVGWEEIDALCQSNFSADILLSRWSVWRSFLLALAQDENLNKRRASLVLLVRATSQSSDVRLHQLAYQNIETLTEEKDILITKAVSWLLRSMADTEPEAVRAYIDTCEVTLPSIAVRETRKKLLIGKKNS